MFTTLSGNERQLELFLPLSNPKDKLIYLSAPPYSIADFIPLRMTWLTCAFLLINYFTESSPSVEELVTVIVKTFERPSCVTQLVRSIRKNYPKLRILVADDRYIASLRSIP